MSSLALLVCVTSNKCSSFVLLVSATCVGQLIISEWPSGRPTQASFTQFHVIYEHYVRFIKPGAGAEAGAGVGYYKSRTNAIKLRHLRLPLPRTHTLAHTGEGRTRETQQFFDLNETMLRQVRSVSPRWCGEVEFARGGFCLRLPAASMQAP